MQKKNICQTCGTLHVKLQKITKKHTKLQAYIYEGLETKVTQSIMAMRLLTTSRRLELKCAYRCSNHENTYI